MKYVDSAVMRHGNVFHISAELCAILGLLHVSSGPEWHACAALLARTARLIAWRVLAVEC